MKPKRCGPILWRKSAGSFNIGSHGIQTNQFLNDPKNTTSRNVRMTSNKYEFHNSLQSQMSGASRQIQLCLKLYISARWYEDVSKISYAISSWSLPQFMQKRWPYRVRYVAGLSLIGQMPVPCSNVCVIIRSFIGLFSL